MKITVETQGSIARHNHSRPFDGKSPQWYAQFGGKCPTCRVTPEFEEIEHTPVKLGVTGLGDKSMNIRRAK